MTSGSRRGIRVAAIAARIVMLGATAALATTIGGAIEGTLKLRPLEGLEQVPFGTSRQTVVEVYGSAELESSPAAWEYPSRCLIFTFGEDGRVSTIGLGALGEPEELASRCVGVELLGGVRIGATLETVQRAYPGVTELRSKREGERWLKDKAHGLTFQFRSDRLTFVVASAGSASENQGD